MRRLKLVSRTGSDPANPDGTTLDLIVHPDGALVVYCSYSGPGTEAFWGASDLEFSMRIEAAHVADFVAAVLRDGFGRTDRLTCGALRRLCLDAGVPVREECWS